MTTVTSERPTIDRDEVRDPLAGGVSPAAERAARGALRRQVAKLERELSGIVAGGFPHIAPVPAQPSTGPHLLSLEELERTRDRLALRLRQAQGHAARRSELEWRSRELLERMKRDPARYKFVRLPVVDLGERGCGVWEVRPRLGLIGMLAGWWQLKLSSGCPLPRAARPARAASPGARRHGLTRVGMSSGPGARQNTSSPRIQPRLPCRCRPPAWLCASWPLTECRPRGCVLLGRSLSAADPVVVCDLAAHCESAIAPFSRAP